MEDLSLDSLELDLKLPRDPDEAIYVKSFDSRNREEIHEASSFLREWGFVVLSNVFTAEECSETRDAMWSIIETTSARSGLAFRRDDPGTWTGYKSSGKYGLSMRGPCFHPRLVKNRVHKRLIEAVSVLMNAHESHVLSGHDRFTIYRPTSLSADVGGVDGSVFRTGPANVHLDLNPWWWLEGLRGVEEGVETLKYGVPSKQQQQQQQQPRKEEKEKDHSKQFQDFIRENNMVTRRVQGGRHLQAAMNFCDNRSEDGGTLVVPRFHRAIQAWTDRYRETLFRPCPWVTLEQPPPDRDGEEETDEVADVTPSAQAHKWLLQRAQRVPMRQGSVLLWDQTLAHGTQPNASMVQRMAQFVKFSLREPSRGGASLSPGEAEGGEGGYWPSGERLKRRARGLATALSMEGCLVAALEGSTQTEPLVVEGTDLCRDTLKVLGLHVLTVAELVECCGAPPETTHFILKL